MTRGERRSPPPRQDTAPSHGELRGLAGYGTVSKLPLHILVFLVPIIVAYEIGSLLYLTDASGAEILTIRARRLLSVFFESFGVGVLHAPAIVIFVTFLLWHFIRGDRWKIRWGVIGGMWIESLAWTTPLIVLALVVFSLPRAMVAEPAMAALAGGVGDLGESIWQVRLTIALGAGLYEELLFRLIAISMVHLLLVDVLKVKETVGSVLAVGVSALGFALYHDIRLDASDAALFLFYLVTGVYLGVIFLMRGFGIVVAIHALYDIVVLLNPPSG